MKVLKGLGLFLLLLFINGCGPDDVSNVFDKLTLGFNGTNNSIEFMVDMNEDSNFPVELFLPIQNYGVINIIPSINDNPARVFISIDVDIAGIYGHYVDKLPNGSPFPRFVEGELLEIVVTDEIYVYVSLDPFRYLGFTYLIPSFEGTVPAGSVLTSYFKKDSKIIGAGLAFGPKPDGSAHGGIFAVADIENVIDATDSIIGNSHEDSKGIKFDKEAYKKLKKAGYLK